MEGIVLIPAFQPDERMVALVEGFMRQEFSVIIVDDGSGPGFSCHFTRAESLGAVVLKHDANRGKGRAIKTALAYLARHDESADFVITVDADGQHSQKDTLHIAKAQQENPGSVILGTRSISDMPLRSRLGNTLSRILFWLRAGLTISDTQTGLRSLPRRIWEAALKLPGERYEFETNMLLYCKRADIPIVEVPIDTIYIDGNRSSHFRPIRDALSILSRFFSFSLSAILCAAIDYALFSMLITLSIIPAYAYVAARILSGSVNFTLNQCMVFHSKLTHAAAIKYIALLLGNMLVGALSVQAFHTSGAGPLFAKLAIDAVLFIANYFIQKHFIFTILRIE